MFPTTFAKNVPVGSAVIRFFSATALKRSTIKLVFENTKPQYSSVLCSLVVSNSRSLRLRARGSGSRNAYRALSSDTSSKQEKSEGASKAEDGSDETQIVLTPGQKVVAYSRLGMWSGILAFACACAYYIGRELFPSWVAISVFLSPCFFRFNCIFLFSFLNFSKMSPNSVFDCALEEVRNNAEVKHRYGEPIKGYGRDHGGHREGRRNFIECVQNYYHVSNKGLLFPHCL